MPKALSRCPVCEGTLNTTELTCGRCQTRIAGTFDPCRFCRLAPEHLGFIEMFLRCEGNLSRVEKELNLSYPTVRNRLSLALVALGFAPGQSQEPEPAEPGPDYETRRRSVLDALATGTLSAEDAAEALRHMN